MGGERGGGSVCKGQGGEGLSVMVIWQLRLHIYNE